jgi:hypothetical protein
MNVKIFYLLLFILLCGCSGARDGELSSNITVSDKKSKESTSSNTPTPDLADSNIEEPSTQRANNDNSSSINGDSPEVAVVNGQVFSSSSSEGEGPQSGQSSRSESSEVKSTKMSQNNIEDEQENHSSDNSKIDEEVDEGPEILSAMDKFDEDIDTNQKKHNEDEQEIEVSETASKKESEDKISDELIESIADDLEKVSGVIEDMNKFIPLEKVVAPVSFHTNLRASSKFLDKNNDVIQYFYEMKKNETKFENKIHSVNLSSNLVEGNQSFISDKKIKKLFSDKRGNLFYMNSDMEIIKLTKPEKIELKLKENGRYRIKTSADSVCLINKNKDDVALISSGISLVKSVKNNFQKAFCIKREVILVFEDYFQVIGKNKEKIESFGSCLDKKVIFRNNELFLSCKKDSRSREFRNLLSKQKYQKLPNIVRSKLRSFRTKMKRRDIAESSKVEILSLNNITETITSIFIDAQKYPSKLKLFNNESGYQFVGHKDLYNFDNEFSFVSKREMPFYPFFKIDDTFFNHKLVGFDLDEKFEYKKYIFKKNRYLDEFKSPSQLTSLSLENQALYSESNLFKFSNVKNILKFYNSSVEGRFSFTVDGFIHSRRSDNGFDLTIYDGMILKKQIKIKEISRRSKFSKMKSGNILSYNGRFLSSFSIEDGTLLNKVEKRHFRKVVLTDNGQQLLITRSSNGISSDINILRDKLDKGVQHISNVNIDINNIRNIEMIENYLVIHNKNKSLTIKKINRLDLLMESQDE